MEDRHTITARDQWFLDKHMKDPVTQERFKTGDTIIICANCRTVHYDSTWGLNPKKCCSICEGNKSLRYSTFSPELFQRKVTCNKGFKIVVERVPFLQRLKLFNGYPAAKTTAILLPVALTGILCCTVNDQKELDFHIFTQLPEVQEKVGNLGDSSYRKEKEVIAKVEEINTDFSGLDSKIDSIIVPIENARSNYKYKNLDEKIDNLLMNSRPAFKRISDKMLSMFNKISDAFTHLLEEQE